MLAQLKVLTGHISESTAYVVADYPCGFQKWCTIRYWIETTGKGQRMCSQTTNPDKHGQVWSKPARSTYSDLCVLYIDANTGHVKNAGLGRHAVKREVDAFLSKYGEANFTDDYSLKTLELMKKYRHLMMERFSNDASLVQIGVPVEE